MFVVDQDDGCGRMVSAAELAELLIARMPSRNRAQKLRARLERAWDTPKRWGIIREYYALRHAEIMASDRFYPYELGLERWLTPIEAQLWQDIRGYGLPFLMQYPVGRRFVDFGDPHAQIAIEADGAAYHTPEKDAAKDAELHAHGWRVYRIKGRDTYGKSGTTFIHRIAYLYGRCRHESEDAESD